MPDTQRLCDGTGRTKHLKTQKYYNLNMNSKRDVAQLVARVLWEHDVAGSNPVIPTKKQATFFVWLVFLLGVSIRFCLCNNAGSHTAGITSLRVILSFRPSKDNPSFPWVVFCFIG